VHRAVDRLHWYWVALALGAALASAACMMLAWRRLLADLGSKLPLSVAARVTFMAQLGKYMPGGFWSLAAHVELGKDYDVPRRRGAASVIVWVAGLIAVGLMFASVSLPLASPSVARRYLFFLAAVPIIATCLAPPILHRLLNFALKVIKQEPLEQQVSWRGLGAALAWMVAGWFLLGIQIWLLIADLANDGVRSLPIAVGAYALAFSLALLLVVFPSGIGVREAILVAALAPVLNPGAALAVALVSRVITTVSDVTLGGVAVTLARRRGRHRKAPVMRGPIIRTATLHAEAAGHPAEIAPS
jgi:glycosyltransferase 2 family protein